MVETGEAAQDHVGISDGFAARRYFAKFAGITTHLGRVAAEMARAGTFSKVELEVLGDYAERLAGTFRALGNKYLLTGRDTGTFFGSLAIDVMESGFPVQRELLTMAADSAQAERHLAGMPDRDELLRRMIGEIVGDLSIPTRLQFAMSQRLYYEALASDKLFWPAMDPLAVWLSGGEGERRYLLHWGVYDSQVNLPVVYLLELVDTGASPCPRTQAAGPRFSVTFRRSRWPG